MLIEFASLFIMVIISSTSFILPQTLYYMISAITIIFISIIHLNHVKEDLNIGKWFILAGLLAVVIYITIGTALTDSLIVLETFFLSRILIIKYYKIKDSRKQKENNNENITITKPIINLPETTLSDINNTERLEKITDLIDTIINNFSKSLEDVLVTANSAQKQQIESVNNKILKDSKKDIILEVKKVINDKSKSYHDIESTINLKIDSLNDSLTKITTTVQDGVNQNSKFDIKDFIEESVNNVLNHIKAINDSNNAKSTYSELIEAVIEKLKEEKMDFSNTRHLRNREIREYFEYSFKEALNEIDIVCPWISRWVLEKEFISMVEGALKRKVIIKIVYGIEDNYKTDRSDISDDVVIKFIEKLKKYENQIHMKKGNTHYKVLICDDKFCVHGSFNYLSFKGDYIDPMTRDEGADYSENKEQIKVKRKIYFDF